MGRWRYDDFSFPRSTPRSVTGGIKAQTQRGTFGESWWAKRWIQVLEGFHIGARLRRGRSYARRGQVISIVIDKGLITATVQGSRPRPYAVTINVKSISTRGWNRLAKILSGSALYAASAQSGSDVKTFQDLNLTRASHVFHFDRWWNPAVENQATDRAFRIGQTHNVQVHKYLCAGTLEERIDELIERKKNVAEQVIGTGEGWLTELSNDELKELFALRPEAVGV